MNIAKDGGASKPYTDYADGELTGTGGTVSFKAKGSHTLTLTMIDVLGRAFAKSFPVTVYPIPAMQIALPAINYSNEPISVVATGSKLEGLAFVWNLSIDGAGAPYTGTLGKNGGEIHLDTDATKTIKLTVVGTDQNGRSFTFASPTVKLMPIIQCSFTAPAAVHVGTGFNVTMQTISGLEGKSIVWSLTKDGNSATYNGSLSNNGGTITIGTTGSYTLTAKVTNDAGRIFSYSKVINITNTAPNKPTGSATVIRSNSKEGKLFVNITAASTDPDGDAITYVWENRPSQTSYYPLVRNVVRVKAVDATGLESQWAAIIFFVADANSGGGMTLTGPESVIIENGLEGATIQRYTFTVPPVSGHSGSDYGRVRGYNIQTGQWDQLDYQTTSNGITFTRTLTPGIYSKLEMYYYTNHNCMYNKSNITYSVEFFWNTN